MKSETGICMYCGQVNQIEVEDSKTLTEEEKNTLATKRCTCEQAMNAQEQEKVVSDAERNIHDLFQKDMPEVEEILQKALPAVHRGEINSVTLDTKRKIKAKISKTSKGNINGYVPGMLRTMVDPVAYVDNVENIVETEGGADRESDENLAERIYLAPSSWSVAGPDDAYKYWVKTYDVAITDVRVFSPEPGIVEIYFLLQDGELPDQAIIDGVESFLRQEDVRPLTDLVMVKQPEERHYQIDATYYINESDRNRAAVIVKQVDAAALEYIKWQRQKIGRDINPDELRKVMVMAGAKRVQVRSPTFEKIPRNCVAVLDGEAQVIYGGVEDD